MERDEGRLIERAVKGDGAAFSELMAAHEKRMYAVAFRLCGNHEDAQDCLQDSMIRVYKAISSFKGQSSFATWLYRITTNTCLDELRRRKTRQSTSLDGLLDTGWSPSDELDTPERHALMSEKRREIERAIADLPDDMRAAIVLRDIQGFSYEEIARILDANVGTVKSRISRGRERLREKLKETLELFAQDDV